MQYHKTLLSSLLPTMSWPLSPCLSYFMSILYRQIFVSNAPVGYSHISRYEHNSSQHHVPQLFMNSEVSYPFKPFSGFCGPCPLYNSGSQRLTTSHTEADITVTTSKEEGVQVQVLFWLTLSQSVLVSSPSWGSFAAGGSGQIRKSRSGSMGW